LATVASVKEAAVTLFFPNRDAALLFQANGFDHLHWAISDGRRN